MYYNEPIKKVLESLKTSESGLTGKNAKVRLLTSGLNKIKKKKELHPFIIFLQQFRSFIIYILISAVIISLLIGEFLDAIVIFAILLLNAVLGFIQEYKAEKSIEALQELSSPKAKVIRDGKTEEIDSCNLVPGDIIIIESGDKIPADARLIEISNLQTLEAALTGESLPIDKGIGKLKDRTPVADRKNMIFSSTIVTSGHGKAVVVRTGMKTQIGHIARMIQETKDEMTPLQKKLRIMGEWLGAITIFVCLLVIAGGLIKGGDIFHWLLIGVSLAVAAIPEGLPAVVTISLAMGVQRMVKKNSLVRKLPSVETLGSITTICTDKTGTLTCNEMTVKKIYANNKVYELTGTGYDKKGGFTVSNKLVSPSEISMLLKIGVLCNNAELVDGKVIGDPTEGALIVSAAKAGMESELLKKRYPRSDEIPFSSERKIMSTQHKMEEKGYILVKGAPEVLLARCDRILIDGKEKRMTRDGNKRIRQVNEMFAKDALRVLGFAYKHGNKINEKGLIWAGLQGMIDPPREEAKDAISKCRKAGIKVIMITGDQEITAVAIAKEIGIKGKSLSGNDLDTIIKLDRYIEKVSIFARVNPEHKIKIIEALKKKGHIVAMTGDGVNDAPALKKADIGVAMGITGTDVAKEASDMILTDDNFASIVNAIEEGRGIYDNIKKFVNYLLSSNLGEVMILFIAMMIGFRSESGQIILPLIAIHILWINIVTDGLPALALGLDKPDPEIMKRKPRDPKEHIISENMILNILVIGILMTISVLFLFNLNLGQGVVIAQTIAFTTLVVLEIVRVYMVRMKYHAGFFSNKYLLMAIMSSILLQLAVIYTPLNRIFGTVPLGLVHWAQIIGVSIVVFIIGAALSPVIRKVTHEMD